MAVPFGFSVGDFIAAIRVLKDTIDALGDTKGASADYRELQPELPSLQNGLKAIQGLTLNDSQRNSFAAVEEAFKDFQKYVDSFLVKISKYEDLQEQKTKSWSLDTFKQNLH